MPCTFLASAPSSALQNSPSSLGLLFLSGSECRNYCTETRCIWFTQHHLGNITALCIGQQGLVAVGSTTLIWEIKTHLLVKSVASVLNLHKLVTRPAG